MSRARFVKFIYTHNIFSILLSLCFLFIFTSCFESKLSVTKCPQNVEIEMEGVSNYQESVSSGQCNIPNQFSVVRQIANDNPDQHQQGHLLNLDRSNGGPKSQSLDDPRWAFMDQVVRTLNSKDSRWGYTCVRGDCEDISTDAIAYLCNDDNTATITVDIINGNGPVQWLVHDVPGVSKWKFPRPGSDNPGNGITVDNDISDFSWSKVVWLNSHDVSNWKEASKISSVDVKQNGQVCIDHTKKGRWPAGNPLGGGALEGNPYIIVKIEGTYYAATYEWLRPGQVCKLGHAGPLSVTYSGEHSIGKHTKKSPLKDLALKGGEVIGFMVSGLARHNTNPNIRERSDIVWYKLPPADGVSQGEKIGTYSDSSNNVNCCPPPNKFGIVQKVARATEDLFKTDPSQFTQHVAQCLKVTDRRWGRRRNDSGTISFDVVAYNVSNNSTPYSVDIILGGRGPDPKLHWSQHGKVGGSWLPVTGSCILDEDTDDTVIEGVCSDLPNKCIAGDFHNHPKDSDTEYLWTCRNRPHVRYKGKRETPCRASKSDITSCSEQKIKQGFRFKDGRCLPPCEFFASKVKTPGVEMGKDEECEDTENYNIAYVNKKTHDTTSCCLRSSKNSCPSSHYYLLSYNGESNCFPSCGNAARLAGWRGSGPDRQPRTNDDTHVLGDAPCANLERFGRDDWKDMPSFYDPYTFRWSHSVGIREVLENLSKSCCVRGARVNEPSRKPIFLEANSPLECE